MVPIEYIGCFFEAQCLQQLPLEERKGPLDRTIASPHVTFQYMPEVVPYELFGAPITVKVIGYGCNEENEALLIAFLDLPWKLQLLAREILVPHITLSVAKTARPVNSRHLDFQPISPFVLHGYFGAMDTAGNIHITAKSFPEAYR